jgi:hypothetical protein
MLVFMNRSFAVSTSMLAYPGVGVQANDREWKLHCAGIVFQSPAALSLRQRMLIRMLGRVMNATKEDLRSSLFRERILPFVAEGTRDCRIQVSIGSHSFELEKPTRKSGQFQEWLTIKRSRLAPFIETDKGGSETVKMQILIGGESDVQTESTIFLLHQIGTSIISDIDDTIKESAVVDRRELLANTFLKEFRPVEGMAEVYRTWADQGVSFHYVSSSPWQLYAPLLALWQKALFPAGTMHLKNFRFRDHFFPRMKFVRHGKSAVIRSLIHHVPERQFILIGDSGEKDPEIYAKICRKHPRNIKGVFIRDLPERPLALNRWQRTKASLHDGSVSTFQTADELKHLVQALL